MKQFVENDWRRKLLSALGQNENAVIISDFDYFYDIVCSQLSERDKEILNLRYKDDFTLKECGALLGLTKERVRQLETRILSHLRNDITYLLYGHEAEQHFNPATVLVEDMPLGDSIKHALMKKKFYTLDDISKVTIQILRHCCQIDSDHLDKLTSYLKNKYNIELKEAISYDDILFNGLNIKEFNDFLKSERIEDTDLSFSIKEKLAHCGISNVDELAELDNSEVWRIFHDEKKYLMNFLEDNYNITLDHSFNNNEYIVYSVINKFPNKNLIKYSNLSNRAKKYLQSADIYTISKLKELTVKEILDVENIGVNTVKEIIDCLKNDYDIDLKGIGEVNLHKKNINEVNLHINLETADINLSNRIKSRLLKKGFSIDNISKVSVQLLNHYCHLSPNDLNELNFYLKYKYNIELKESIDSDDIVFRDLNVKEFNAFLKNERIENTDLSFNIKKDLAGFGISTVDELAELDDLDFWHMFRDERAFYILDFLKKNYNLTLDNSFYNDKHIVYSLVNQSPNSNLIKNTNLSGKSKSALKNAGIYTVSKLKDFTSEELLNIGNIGVNRVEEIIDCLKNDYNFNLKSPDNLKELKNKHFQPYYKR